MPSTPPRPVLPLWAALLTGVVGGFVLDLAFPDLGWWPFAFVSVAFGLVSLIGRSVGGALLVGLAYGASFYFTHLVWVGRYLGPIPWYALAGVETVFFALGAVLITLAYRWFPRGRPWLRLIGLPALVAALWVLRELVMGSWPYTGFPWGRIGMTQSESPLAHLASWVGVSGLTFLMVFVCAAAIEWVRAGRMREVRTLLPTAVGAIVLLAVPAFPTTAAGEMTVGAVQGNGPSGYFDRRERGDILAAQIDASEPLFGQKMDVLLWPEGGIDSDPLNSPVTAAALNRVAARADAPLLVNAATERGQDVFNTSMVWVRGEGAVELHDKTHPVPFGEYVPDRWFYEMLVPDLVGLIGREYTPGTNDPVIEVADVPVGLAICFDVIYDDVVWDGAREGAQVYMFQTNNADFRGTDENLQQLAFARMRAIETGRSVVNISTVGTSQVIAPDGSMIDGLSADVAGAMLTQVPLRTGLTPAVIIGPAVTVVLGWGSILTLFALGLARVIARRRGGVRRRAGAGTG